MTPDEREPGKTTLLVVRWDPETSPSTIADFERAVAETMATGWKRYGMLGIELDTR